MRTHLQRVGNLFVIGLLRSPLHCLASALAPAHHLSWSPERPLLHDPGYVCGARGDADDLRWSLGAEAVVVQLARWRRGRGAAPWPTPAGAGSVVGDSAAVETYLDRYPRARMAIEAAPRPPSFASPR